MNLMNIRTANQIFSYGLEWNILETENVLIKAV